MPKKVKIYHRDGHGAEVFSVDAREAVERGKGEWSYRPFAAEKKVEADEKSPAKPRFVAQHRGRGSFSVMEGDKEVVEGLTKEGAEKKAAEMNAAG
ncbi:hypothetical protein [Chelatococcus sp. XZ-Ab1]|uniref:hypothetical protein n=1 Tax=Chelatococcus sp. XZ-Ab1 TaxID=3034027 RepID=UPI0023E3FFD0|nr:hypothetical protein [Chelatococcus sp. XZ-Ab1]